ncbi:transposase [Caedibacter taeniospiralis]|uniref:transposase n=1 Tax=Caedibacter taeniospiralis TaxID=28907 RepID=UPI0037BF55F9
MSSQHKYATEFMDFHRHTIRLKGYDYSQKGAYFVTICTQDKACIFGEIIDDKMVLNEIGKIVHNEWLNTSKIRSNIICDVFIVMPNHIHGIIVINESYGSVQFGRMQSDGRMQYAPTEDMLQVKLQSPSQTIGAIVRGFKASVTKQINELQQTRGQTIWQRNYYEHVIRDADDYNRVYEYIENNPQRWSLDSLNPNLP